MIASSADIEQLKKHKIQVQARSHFAIDDRGETVRSPHKGGQRAGLHVLGIVEKTSYRTLKERETCLQKEVLCSFYTRNK